MIGMCSFGRTLSRTGRMEGRNWVAVMRSVRGEDLSHLPLADGIVLAVAAFQGAAGEEDSAASAFPADTGLLPEV